MPLAGRLKFFKGDFRCGDKKRMRRMKEAYLLAAEPEMKGGLARELIQAEMALYWRERHLRRLAAKGAA